MTCTEFLAMLDDMFDEKVAAETRTEIEEHLRGCDHCVVTLNTTRKKAPAKKAAAKKAAPAKKKVAAVKD